MSDAVRALVALAGLLAGAAQSSPALRPMTVDDLLDMVGVEDAVMSPDGDQVIYRRSELDWANNRRRRLHRLVRFDGTGDRPFLGDPTGSGPRFSRDGGRVAFLRDVDGEDQIFVIDMSGGEAVQATQHRSGVAAFRWGVGDRIVFAADERPDGEAWKEHELGNDPVFVDEAPNGKHEAFFRNLWSLDLASGESTRLTDEALVIGEFDVAGDGRVAFVARPDRRTNYPFEAELYVLEPGGAPRRLTANRAPESDPRWSPDGARLVYRAPSDTSFDLRNGHFWIVDPATGASRRLDGQQQGSVGAFAWSPDGRYVLFSESRRTASNLHRLDVESDEVVAVTAVPGTLRALSYSADRRRVVMSAEDFTTPADLVALELGEDWTCPGGPDGCRLTRLTDANPEIRGEIALSEGEVLRWTSKGDMEIEGIYLPAIGVADGERAAMILHVHGGPAGVMGNRFEPELQILAGLGYAVLAPNFRGSSGYGDELLQGLMGEVGDGELEDLLTGVDHVLQDRGIDPERLGIRGWSWGGVSSSYAITQTDRFKAASVGAMVGNWAAETGPGFNFDVSLWYIGGTPWDDPEEWALRSSITHVRNVTTPTILFHGAEDETSSVGQSLMFFTALRDIGKVPVRYIKFPRQGHGIEEPRLLRVQLVEEIRWFERYIDGAEWTPWRRGS